MNEKKRVELKRNLKEAVEKRKHLNVVVEKNDAQKVIEIITKIIEKLNSDEYYLNERIPYIMVVRSGEEILIASNRNLVDITGSLGQYSNATWKEVKEFLCDTLGRQETENAYMIPFRE